MRYALIVVIAAYFTLVAAAQAQTTAEVVSGANENDNVVNYGMGHDQQRYSTLKETNRDTVKDLVPAWAMSLVDLHAQE